jgi:four helix bundle protein
MDLVVAVYEITESFPASERYGLTRQIRRAAASIPANIAEGQDRRLAGEFLQFLGNARGSLLELDTHLEIAHRLKMQMTTTIPLCWNDWWRSESSLMG